MEHGICQSNLINWPFLQMLGLHCSFDQWICSSECWVFVASENIVCTLKCPSLIAKFGKTKNSKFGRIDSRLICKVLISKITLFQLLHNGLSPRIIIDVLRQASKASVVRRQFAKAEILIQEAVLLARETYGEHHLKVRLLTYHWLYLIPIWQT